jgi:ligand-binding sensor domain-containing protein/signal transduction histidine kinase
VRALAARAGGGMWVGMEGRGVRSFGGASSGIDTAAETGRAGVAILEDTDRTLWFGTEGGGLLGTRRGATTALTTRDGLPDDSVGAVAADGSGGLWIGTGRGLCRLKDGRVTAFGREQGLPDAAIGALVADAAGTLWIGTLGRGLYRLRDGAVASFSTKEGLSDDFVRVLLPDREGSLWIGTRGGGLNRLRDGKFVTLSARQGLSSEQVRAVLGDADGSLWIGTDGGGLNHLVNGRVDVLTSANGLPNDSVRALLSTESELWIGTNGGGLASLKNGRFTTFTKKDGLPSDAVLALARDRAGNLWIGTNGGGVSRFRQGRFASWGRKDGLPTDAILSILEDREGTLWIGTNAGLARFRDGTIVRAGAEGPRDDPVVSLHEDGDGSLWIGTYGGGLFRHRAGRFQRFTKRAGLFDDTAYTILEDGRGFLWLSSNRGIARVKKSELDAFADGRLPRVSASSYGKSDGMASPECNAAQPGGWKGSDGRLWFPTVKGLVSIDPARTALNTVPPAVHVEEVLVDGARLHAARDLVVAPGRYRFEFRYTALSFLGPEKVRFKTRLEGAEKDWVDAGTSRMASFTNLRPGPYTFRVVACNNDGVWNQSGDTFSFRLQPRFRETRWFPLACALAAFAAAFGLHRVRVAHLLAVERVRTAIATDLHDDLGASLSNISLLAEVVSRETEGRPQDLAGEIGQSARRMGAALSDDIWSIDPRHDDLRSVADRVAVLAGDLFDVRGVGWEMELPEDLAPRPLPPAVRRHLFLALKEALHNAARHAEARHVSVRFRRDRSRLLVVVSDDGRGLPEEPRRPSGSGRGLPGMRERARQMGGTLEVAAAPGGGTVLTFSLPPA